MKLRPFFVGSLVTILCVAACGGDDDDDAALVAPSSCATAPAPVKVTASCEVTLSSPPLEAVKHVPVGTSLTYCSNPPSSGRHYPVWAAFSEFTQPVPWEYLVHNEEHGGVLLLYKCDAAGCPDIVAALRKVRDDAVQEAACAPGKKRIIIAPSTTILTRVAAAAWGATYQADCADGPALDAFVRDHVGKGPEDICEDGQSFP